jgi:hypothetical protein
LSLSREQAQALRSQIQAELTKRRVEAEAGGWDQERARCANGLDGLLHWFDRYAWTYDPRLIGKPGGAFIQFNLWPRQREAVRWLYGQIIAQEEGLLEKSRDVGATYLCAGVCAWAWMFLDGFKGTFGSRKVDYVDKKDNPDSIFAKLRIILRRQPPELMPVGFSWTTHDNYMRLSNPATGATISGEGGEDMGRGGRSTVYVLDEAAFVPNAETTEAALSGNTDCVIWVSSVNGMGNLFARKRHSILKPRQVFRLHWRDDPRKTDEWAQTKQASFSEPTTWASEYDIDYSASVEGICIPALWVESAKRLADLEPRLRPSNNGALGLDVGAGKAKSVAIVRKGPVVLPPKARGEPDTTGTAHWGLELAKAAGVSSVNFDAPGVGAGVASTMMHNEVAGLAIYPVNTGTPPSNRRWPDERTSEEMFGNLKAEIWWLCRTALQRTHEHVLFLEGKDGGIEHPVTDLLALPSGDQQSDALNLQLSLVKWEKNERGKIVIEKKDALRRRGIASPDHADALMLTFAEQRQAPVAESAFY